MPRFHVVITAVAAVLLVLPLHSAQAAATEGEVICVVVQDRTLVCIR